MVAYSRRPQSGHITCYFNRTFDVLLTLTISRLPNGTFCATDVARQRRRDFSESVSCPTQFGECCSARYTPATSHWTAKPTNLLPGD